MKINKWNKLIFVAALIASLGGCIAVGAAAAGAVGATIVYDRRGIETSMDDQTLAYKISKSIRADQELKSEAHIIVASYHGMVLLAGQAPTTELRTRAVNLAKKVKGSKQIYNEIVLEAPPSELTTTSDAWITTKIKSKFLATHSLKSGQFKVITDNGIVYIMGVVSRDQANTAVEIARQINGVQKVVKIFKYSLPSPADVETETAAKSKKN